MKIVYTTDLPSPEEFQALRSQTGWGVPSISTMKSALNGTVCGVTAFHEEKVVGMIRVVGDGALNIYLQDLIVQSEYRYQNIGNTLIKNLVTELQTTFPADITVGLMAATGLEEFYEQFGFSVRPAPTFGAGMTGSLQSLAKTIGCA